MIDSLKLVNLPSGSGVSTSKNRGDVFILSTCQRTIVLGFNFVPFSYVNNSEKMSVFNGMDAYKALLEIICGLKSHLVGENEIVAQFKEAYENYKQLEGKNSHLMNIMEKLFKDAKQIRMKYLYEIGQHSYAGISRKIIEKCGVTSENETILIFGSGSLALSAIKLLKKKYRLIITARNEQKVKEICREFKIESIPWGNWDQYLEQKNILNTIGAKETTLFTQAFFVRWMEKHEGKNLFIDLGSPSVVNTSLSVQENVYRLEDVFERGAMLEKVKESRVNEAAKAICNLTEQRRSSFTINFPFGWEELQFV